MDLDAYEDDMARFLRLSDEDVDRLFRGLTPEGDEELHHLATFLADVSGSLSGPPRSDVEARHLTRLAESVGSRSDVKVSSLPIATRTGRSAARSAERNRPIRRTVRWVAKVVVAAATLAVVTAALAFAGVDLPGTAADTAFDSVGLSLPNQGAGAADAVDPAKLPADASETATRVLTVIHEWFSGADWSGCEFGARVSHAARGLEGEADTSRCGAGGAGGADGSHGAGDAGNAEHGPGTANEASGGAAAHGAAGRDVADQASGGASNANRANHGS